LRLWSIHPKYLDVVGLVALWRESLLAQKVLKEETEGYKNHPQLKRFRMHTHPQRAIANYLMSIWDESKSRGYHFDKGKIGEKDTTKKIPVTQGQLRYEFSRLCDKLKRRDPHRYQQLQSVKEIDCHPSFKIIEGETEDWEKTKSALAKGVRRSRAKVSVQFSQFRVGDRDSLRELNHWRISQKNVKRPIGGGWS